MMVWNFDVPNASKDVIKNPDLTMDVVATQFIVGDGAGAGIITFDEKEKALCFTPDFTKPGTANLHYQRAVLSIQDDEKSVNTADMPYMKVKFKLVSENDLTTLRIRDFSWKTVEAVAIPEVNTWAEYVVDLSGTSLDGITFGTSNGMYFQFQSMDTGYNTYDETGFKLYIQYIAFFQNEDDANNYR